MSIWSDTAIKELQEKVAWLEKEVEHLKATHELLGIAPSKEAVATGRAILGVANAKPRRDDKGKPS
jgi:hypothetical protein